MIFIGQRESVCFHASNTGLELEIQLEEPIRFRFLAGDSVVLREELAPKLLELVSSQNRRPSHADKNCAHSIQLTANLLWLMHDRGMPLSKDAWREMLIQFFELDARIMHLSKPGLPSNARHGFTPPTVQILLGPLDTQAFCIEQVSQLESSFLETTQCLGLDQIATLARLAEQQLISFPADLQFAWVCDLADRDVSLDTILNTLESSETSWVRGEILPPVLIPNDASSDPFHGILAALNTD